MHDGPVSEGRKEVYRGFFDMSQYHGKGKLKSLDGNLYEGSFDKGMV